MIKLNKDFLAGTVLGFGAGFAYGTMPKGEGKETLRNLTKNAVKWGIAATAAAKVKLAELKENIEDIAAEAKEEAAAPAPAPKAPRSKSGSGHAERHVTH